MTEPPVAPAPTTVFAGLLHEYEQVAALIERMPAASLDTPTVCDGWQVRHALAHVAGQLLDAVSGRGGSRTPDEQANALGSATSADLATAINDASRDARALTDLILGSWDGPAPVAGLTIGEAIDTLWHDTWTHGNDVRDALDIAADQGAGMQASLRVIEARLDERNWPGTVETTSTPTTVRIHLPDRATITVPTRRFLLAATGRGACFDPALDRAVNIYI